MINNYKEFKDFLNKLDYKPKLLLHSCCGPCSTYTLSFLNNYFDITIYYTNDNIYPKEEYNLRLFEQKKVIAKMNLNIPIIAPTYQEEDFNKAILGKENLGEHSPRCYSCMALRLNKTALYAKENNFDYFTTTLSISPYKNSDWINEIGYILEEKYNIKYLYSNFKKEEGYKKSVALSRELGIYRQEYCGCIYSFKERSKS